MISRIVISAVLVAAAYWGYAAWRGSVEKERQVVARQQRAAELRQRVAAMAAKHQAVTDWAPRLAKERIRLSPLLTAELQDLWQSGRPILFVGIVTDIARVATRRTSLTVDHGSLDQAHIFLGTTLRLRLECDATLTEPLLELAKAPTRIRLRSDTAVVASISSIETGSEPGTDGRPMPMVTGVGTCLDLMAIPD